MSRLKQFTLEEFMLFIKNASSKQIERLDFEQLPDDLPDEILDAVPYDIKKTLESLMFEANARTMSINMEIENLFDEQIGTAFALSKQVGRSRANKLFNIKVKELIEQYNLQKESGNEPSGNAAALRSELMGLHAELRQESSAFAHAQEHIKRALAHNQQSHLDFVFEKALAALQERLQSIMNSLNVFTYVRVLEVNNTMLKVYDEIQHQEEEIAKLKQDISEEREILKNLTGSFFSRRRHAQKIDELQDKISQQLDQVNRMEVVVVEDDLLDWLDVFVDANLSPDILERTQNTIDSAKSLLFSLLQKYCQLQESSAKQVAMNPFSQIDPEQSIRYLLLSEKFILDYFLKKKETLTTWLGKAAEAKMGSLKNIEQELLKELKSNARLAK